MVIAPDECIDCGVCVPECPAEAIVEEGEGDTDKWFEINEKYSQVWPNITEKGDPPTDADKWNGVENKLEYLSEEPGEE